MSSKNNSTSFKKMPFFGIIWLFCHCSPSQMENPFLDRPEIWALTSNSSNSSEVRLSFSQTSARPGQMVRLQSTTPLASLGGLSLFLDPVRNATPFGSLTAMGFGSYELKVKEDAPPGMYQFRLLENLQQLQRVVLPESIDFSVDPDPPQLTLENEGRIDVSELSDSQLLIESNEDLVGDIPLNQIEVSGSARNTLTVSSILKITPRSLKLILSGVPNFSGGKIQFRIPGIQDTAGNSTTANLTLNVFAFRSVGNLDMPRQACAGIQLLDGRGFITGGSSNGNVYLDTVEVFDPTTKRFSYGASMRARRREHQILRLPNGNLFVSGGWGPSPITPGLNEALFTTEIYDVATNTWRFGPNLQEARTGHRQTLIGEDMVLVTGGNFASGLRNTIELISLKPNAESSQIVGNLLTPRRNHFQINLSNSKVLIGGGDSSHTTISPLGTLEVFDLNTRQISSLSISTDPRSLAYARILEPGKILIFGGLRRTTPTEQSVFSVEELNTASMTLQRLGSLNYGRFRGASFIYPLGSKRFVISGGREQSGTINLSLGPSDIWSPSKSNFNIGSPTVTSRINACSYESESGGGVSAGGRFVPILRSAEEYSSD